MRSFHPDLEVILGIYPSNLSEICQLDVGKARWSSATIDENVDWFDVYEDVLITVLRSDMRWHVKSQWTYQCVCTHLHAKPELLGVLFLPQTSHSDSLESSQLMHVVDCRPNVAESKMEVFWFRLAPGECMGMCGNASEHPARFRGVPAELSWR